MADRKNPLKKKHSKKIKKTSKKEEKLREKLKDKSKEHKVRPDYSEDSLSSTRRRSSAIERDIQLFYEPERRTSPTRLEVEDAEEFDRDTLDTLDTERKRSVEFIDNYNIEKDVGRKKSSHFQVDDDSLKDELNIKKSREFSRRQLDDEPIRKKSIEFSRKQLDDEPVRAKSREFSRRQFDDEPVRGKSIEFSRKLLDDEPVRAKSREFSRRQLDDEPVRAKSREFSRRQLDDEPVRAKSREFSRRQFDDEPVRGKSREFSRRQLDDEPLRKKSIDFAYQIKSQAEIEKKKSKELAAYNVIDSEDYDEPIPRKSREFSRRQLDNYNIDEPIRRKSRDLSSRRQIDIDEPLRRKSIDFSNKQVDSKLYKRGGENKIDGDYYKKYKNIRNSRISLNGIYTTSTREEAGEQSKVMVVPNDLRKFETSKYDFVEPPDHNRTHLKLAIIWMEICGIAHLSLMFAYGYSENFLAIGNYDSKTGEGSDTLSHYVFGSLWIFICGNAMTLFRIFNKSRTRSIKYFHLTLHTVSFCSALLSVYAFYMHWRNIDIGKHNYSIHAKIGVIAVVSYCFQWIVGLFVYSMTMFRQKFRIQFYHYHSYIGFVVFFMTITTMCSGLVMEEKWTELGYSSNPFTCSWLPRATGIIGVIFSGAVLFIIVYPYFDFAKETELI